MAISSDSISLLFRMRGDSSEAVKAAKEFEASIGGATGSVAALGAALPIAGAAIAAMAAAVVTAVSGLVSLTVASSEYAGAVFDVQEKTSLAAATLSTLKVNADLAESSLESVGGSTAKFARLLGEARAGNEKAQKTLKDLGVTSTDLNTALGQVSKTIFDATGGTEQLVLAQKAFGKGGAEMIPVIKQMGGDLAAATKEAERLGLVMTDKDLAAADALGDSLGLLGAQAKVAGVAFTSDLMVVLARYATMASEFYARNKGEIREWGRTIAQVAADFGRGLVTSFNFIIENAKALRVTLAGITFGVSELVIQAIALLNQYYRARGLKAGNEAQEGLGQAPVAVSIPRVSSTGKGGGGGSSASDADQRMKADLQAQITLQRNALKQYERDYKDTLERIRAEFKKTGNDTLFAEAANEANRKYADSVQVIIDELQRLDGLQARLEKEGENQRAVRVANLKDEVDQINRYKAEELKKNNDLLASFDKELADKGVAVTKEAIAEREKAEQEALDNWRTREVEKYDALIAAGNDELANIVKVTAFLHEQYESDYQAKLVIINAERDRRKSEVEETIRDEKAKVLALAEIDSAADAAKIAAYEALKAKLAEVDSKYAIPAEPAPKESSLSFPYLDKLTNALGSVKQMGLDVFGALAEGFGQMVSNWVLYGNAGEQGLRKMTAAMLANVAQVATTYALLCLAAAALATTVWGAAFLGGSPAQFLKGAALFGAVAVTSAIAGRALAGDSFKKESSGSFGTASSSAQGGGNRSGNGQVFSSQQGGIVETSRNNPGGLLRMDPVKVDLHLKLDRNGVIEVVKQNVQSNGALRLVIQEAI